MTPNGEQMRVLSYLTPDQETPITMTIDRLFASDSDVIALLWGGVDAMLGRSIY